MKIPEVTSLHSVFRDGSARRFECRSRFVPDLRHLVRYLDCENAANVGADGLPSSQEPCEYSNVKRPGRREFDCLIVRRR